MSALEEKKTKPPDKSTDYFKCVKIPIKHVLKNPNINLPKITDAVIKCNKIVINTLMFMKLYLLDYFEKNNKLPEIDKVFVNSCMKILCNESASGRPPKKEIKELKDKLTTFYNSDYKPLIKDTNLDYTHLNTVLDYLTIGIITIYENNIKLHYVEYIERYVNIVWKKKETITKIKEENKDEEKQKDLVNEFCRQLRKIKIDILEPVNKYKSDEKYHNWIKDIKKIITPNKEKYQKDSLYYDLQCNPQDYLPCMIIMMKEVEKDKVMIYNIFPMRNDIIMKSIKLDTTTLVHLLFTQKQGNKTDYLLEGNLKKFEDKIWEFFFRTERQCFKKPKYTFHHMIETDGVSCSILMLRNDLIGKRIPNIKVGSNTEQYIDELIDYTNIKNKKIVCIDPGKSDILYCVDNDNKDANEFRYTQDSRRKECKIKKYAKIILEFKKEKIDGKTVIEYETELSKLNRKTLIIKDFKEYIKKKSEINNKLYKFYEKYIFRKLKLNGYINKKKNEQKLINNFKKIFGKPEETIVIFGDFEQKQHMKYKEPIKGKGMRMLFRQNNYKTYLVDEFRTSCMCSICKTEIGRCEKFQIRENPKPYKSGNILVHGLLTCKKCSGVWNRDVNGATNIYKIAKNAINGLERPKYLCRKKKEENLKVEKLIKEKVKKVVQKKANKSVGVVALTKS
uniref:Cas12f1-like TNB domain-containing protein n=1 Tax=viral metagenome TaxID=1070528 RepID=A0A6C0H7S1_9ZZZZ